MTERRAEPIFCSECQNEVDVRKARVLDGLVLCPKDLSSRGVFSRLRARKLPEHARRRGGKIFSSFFLSLAALMFVVGLAFIWKVEPSSTVAGVSMILGSIFVAFLALLVADVVDLLLDIFDQLRRLNKRL